MIQNHRPSRLRFEGFELNTRTGELWRNGRRVPLQDQSARLLAILATHPGELVTREDIRGALWGEDEFVEFEHAINTAVKKIRDALEDDPRQPKLIETLPRKGYRFLAPVEQIEDKSLPPPVTEPVPNPDADGVAVADAAGPGEFALPLPVPIARFLFLFIQTGYLAIYCGALFYYDGLEDALDAAGLSGVPWRLVVVLAMCGIAVRIYLLSAVGWAHPAAGDKFRRLFPGLLIFDAMWAASPLLVTRAIGIGIALAGVAGLAYVPFAQRTLIRGIYRSLGDR